MRRNWVQKGSFENRKANTPFITINNMFALIILLK
jgi:hypothetical protein